MLVRMWIYKNSHSLLAGMQDGRATLKTVRQTLTKLNILLSYNTAITLLGIYPHELKIYVKDLSPYKNLHMDVYSSFIARDE